MKRILAFLLAFLMLASFSVVFAESSGSQPVTTSLDEFKGYTAETIMQKIYTANSLYSVFETHERMRVLIECESMDGSTAYTKTLEASHSGADTHVRIHLESPVMNGEMEGSSEAGYVVCRWDDGTYEAACSFPDEFLPLVQETYLEPYEHVNFDNVILTEENGLIVVYADMHYKNGEAAHSVNYSLSPDDFHLLSVSDAFAVNAAAESVSVTRYTFAYDQEETLEKTTVLNDVMYADDAQNLNIVFVAPEYGFTQVKSYLISESVTTHIDSRGYFNLYTSSELSRESEVDNIVINGDTTVYAVITSYMLQDEESKSTEVRAYEEHPVEEDTRILKNPYSETVSAGGSALFTADASNYSSIYWSLSDKNGSTILATDAANYFGGLRVYGCGTTTLALENIPSAMNDWSVKCNFISHEKTVSTEYAKINVNEAKTPEESRNKEEVIINRDSQQEFKAIAQQYSFDAVENVEGRIGSWGWNVNGVSSYMYDENSNTSRFGIDVSNGSKNATFYFVAYPALKYYVPIGVDSTISTEGSIYPLINRNFYSTTDSASCWASFGDALVAISNANADVPSAHDIPDISDTPDITGESDEPGIIEENEEPVINDSPDVTEESDGPVINDSPEINDIPFSEGFTPGQNLGSGSLSSAQSDLLVMHVNWNAVAESSDTVALTLNVTLQSRSISTGACALAMDVGGQNISFYPGGFVYEDNSAHYTPLGSYTFKINASNACSIPITVLWNFKGTYHEVYIENLYVMGTANIG